MSNRPLIAVAEGDGIGPEIMQATLQILKAAQANIDIEKVEIGEKVYLQGETSGITAKTWETIRRAQAFLKAPITTPQGGGFKSLNVTVRTSLGLYANVRPCVAYSPFVKTKHPDMDVVIIRENEEDLYVGIEYQQTAETYQALKMISRPGSEKIIRYAFEYALQQGRKKVTCFSKDNILKMTDGQFHKVFEEIGKEYPQIEKEHWIVDIGAAKLADTPEAFDVIVMPNLYGDILSDVAAQIAGSVGMAGSANIGSHGAMFEAIHGSAPRRAGQNLANPSGLILASVLMLIHLGQPQTATLIHNAWLKTIEEGIHTYDLYREGSSKQKVGTKEFAQAVVERLGQQPTTLPAVHYDLSSPLSLKTQPTAPVKQKELMGADIFIEWQQSAEKLADALKRLAKQQLQLEMISNRGAKVWPGEMKETFCVDCYRCRFFLSKQEKQGAKQIASFLAQLAEDQLDVTQVQYLFHFDGKAGYSSSTQL